MKIWRSQEEQQNKDEFKPWVEREFQPEASVLETPVSRRSFIKLLGGTVAIAGLSGCVSIRKPVQKLVPYAQQPEFQVPGKSIYYASTYVDGAEVSGVLVESTEGRPIKIEGNPLYPGTGGKTSAIQQAAIIGLYDPDRAQFPTVGGKKSTWDAFGEYIRGRVSAGAKVAVLSEPQVSGTFFEGLAQLRKNAGPVAYFQYDPVGNDAELQGSEWASGRALNAVIDYKTADVIVSLGADFLGSSDLAVSNTQAFASRRDPDSGVKLNRLYAFESRYSLTGSRADHRVRVDADDMIPTALGLVAVLAEVVPALKAKLTPEMQIAGAKFLAVPNVAKQKKYFAAIADDISKNGSKSVFVVGKDQAPELHALAFILNNAIGALFVSYYAPAFGSEAGFNGRSLPAITELVRQMNSGQITDLIIIGGNPVVTAPADLKFKQSLKQLNSVTHLTQLTNETSRASKWVLPRAHFLEKWGDAQRIDGVTSVIQPLIRPIVDAKSDTETLAVVGRLNWRDFDAVRAYFKRPAATKTDATWKKWLHDGVVSTVSPAVTPTISISPELIKRAKAIKAAKNSAITGIFIEDYSVRDGRHGNSSWMQEIPDTITKLTWDNALLVSPQFAKAKGVENEALVEVKTAQNTVTLPIWVVPGMADRTVGLLLGYGQNSGRISAGAGVDVFPLRTSTHFQSVGIQSITKTGRKYTLATTQNHGAMEGRDLVRKVSESELHEDPKAMKEMGEEELTHSVFNEYPLTGNHQWGMTIDLSRCTGCNACTVACQSENNIPIVGKKEVIRGREMHWIRIDRYFSGDENEPEILDQPVTCLQCELAPCEQVCPVVATTHTKEGLNDMTYNRCIGTRYCANACPVKVRHFNFFDYQQRDPRAEKKNRLHLFDAVKEPAKSLQMQFNPEVTVRMRGVMEKCTYCVQRINRSKFEAKNGGKKVSDVTLQTACQQACPASAIVFGDLSDSSSAVSKSRKSNRDYTILGHLNLKARTRYLGAVYNPHPSLVPAKKKEVA